MISFSTLLASDKIWNFSKYRMNSYKLYLKLIKEEHEKLT